MRRQMWIIILLLSSADYMQCQIVDDFSGPNAVLNQLWLGDRDLYQVNSQEELQLQDTSGGRALIYQSMTWQEDMSWEFLVRMDFNPSNNNRLELYLWSEDAALTEGDGYLLRLGQNGSEDAIELINQSGNDRTVIASGSMGLVAEGPLSIRFRISVSGSDLLVEVDETGDVCFVPEFSSKINAPELNDALVFGWESIYTSSRKDKFFFDDIYVGSLRVDDIAPSVSSLSANETSVELTFSEAMNLNDLTTDELSISPDVSTPVFSTTKNGLTITPSAGFNPGVQYQLSLSNLEDLAGNALDTVLTFEVAFEPIVGSLNINEILFNPRQSGADFIEITNTSSGAIELSNVILSNSQNSQQVQLEKAPSIKAGAYLVLTKDKDNIITSYPNHDAQSIFEIDIPSFNNDDGNVTLSINDEIIDSFDYDEDLHNAFIDNVDGISLERISLDEATDDPKNWSSASEASGFGTPGLTNSISGSEASDLNTVIASDKTFSPNGDGDKDELKLNYNLDGPGYLGTVKIYDDRGQQIVILINNQILGNSGVVTWDGRTKDGSIAGLGIYIVHISFFNVNGSRFEKKITIGLADFLN